jgi:hypothetical protein
LVRLVADAQEARMNQEAKDIIDAAPVLTKPPADAPLMTNTHYCREDLIEQTDDLLIGAWHVNFTRACMGVGPRSALRKDSVIDLQRFRRCADTGLWVISCEHY